MSIRCFLETCSSVSASCLSFSISCVISRVAAEFIGLTGLIGNWMFVPGIRVPRGLRYGVRYLLSIVVDCQVFEVLSRRYFELGKTSRLLIEEVKGGATLSCPAAGQDASRDCVFTFTCEPAHSVLDDYSH